MLPIMKNPSHRAGCWADGAAVLFAMVFPSALTWVYFVALSGPAEPGGAQPAVYAGGKTIQFVFPVLWVLAVQRRRLSWPRPRLGGLAAGLAFGLAVFAAGLAIYRLGLQSTDLLRAATAKSGRSSSILASAARRRTSRWPSSTAWSTRFSKNTTGGGSSWAAPRHDAGGCGHRRLQRRFHGPSRDPLGGVFWMALACDLRVFPGRGDRRRRFGRGSTIAAVRSTAPGLAICWRMRRSSPSATTWCGRFSRSGKIVASARTLVPRSS